MKHSITFTDTTVTLDSGTIQTRKVKEPEMVCKRLQRMGIETLKPFQARRMFEEGVYFCDDKEITLTYDDTSVTLDTCVGDFTRMVKTPKFVWFRLRALGIEALSTHKAKRLFDRGCSFYDSQDKLALVFVKGQQVRHKVLHSIRIATYNDALLWNDQSFSSLNKFVSNHYSHVHPSRKNGNSWAECETLVGDKWVSLREFYFGGVSL